MGTLFSLEAYDCVGFTIAENGEIVGDEGQLPAGEGRDGVAGVIDDRLADVGYLPPVAEAEDDSR